MSVLCVEHVSKTYGRKKVLKDVNFSIEKGEIVALVGPNGVGKTTLLKTIAHVSPINEGKILINGNEGAKNRIQYLSDFSCIIESPSFMEELSGLDNLKLVAKINKASSQRVEEVLSFVNLSHIIHQKVAGYSLGMKQRLGLGMALLQNPTLIILDEPTNGLDLSSVLEFRKVIMQLKEKGISFLISTHIVSDIESLSDRILFLKEGEVNSFDSLKLQNGKQVISLVSEEYDKLKLIVHSFGGVILDTEVYQNFKCELRKEDVPIFLEQLVNSKIIYQKIEISDISFEDIYKSIY